MTTRKTSALIYYGDAAVRAACEYYDHPYPPSYVATHIIHEEGFVPGTYEDTKGILTEGIGLTGKYIGKNFFTEVLPEFEEKARRKVSCYDSMPDFGKAAVLSAIYRGDLGPRTAKLLSNEHFNLASIEYLNHREYKQLKEHNPRSGIVARMERNAYAFSRITLLKD